MPVSSSRRNNKRFLFLITHYYPVVFGAELFALKLAEYLATLGHQVDVVTGKWESNWNLTEVVHGVNVWRLPVIKIRGIQTIAFTLPQWWYAQHQLDQYDYDYLHAHIFPSLVTGALLNTKAKKILTIQGGDLADYPEVYGRATPVIKPIIGQSLKQYETIHAVSSDLKKMIKKLSNKKAFVIPNGVDSKLLKLNSNKKLKQKYFPKTTYVAFSPSRLTDKNNLQETIEAIKLCRRKNIDIGLVIAGTGHLKSSLEKKIESLELAGFVRLIGVVDHLTSLKLSASADCVVRVSKQEGFGISLLEGLAVGTPVVASRAGGLADFISDSVAHVPNDTSAQSMANSFKDVFKSNNSKKIKAGQKLVSQNYTWESILPRFCEQVYGFNPV